MEYEVLNLDEAPVTDLSEIEAVPPDLDIRPVGHRCLVEVEHFVLHGG